MNTDWRKSSLDKISSLIKDGSHGTHVDIPDGIPFLSAKDVRDGLLLVPDDCRRIKESDFKTIHKNYKIAENDILLTIVGTIGRCYLVTGTEPRFSIQRSVAVIRPDGIWPEYLYHFIKSWPFQSNLKDFTNASAQGGVYLGALSRCEIKYPAILLEQSKIAEILTTVDQAIEQTESLIAKQQRIKTGLMQDLLTCGIDEHGNIRSEENHEFKDSQLGRIPVEWEVKKLLELVDEGVTYGIVQAGPHIENGVPYIRTGDMADDEIDVSKLLRTSHEIAKAYKRSTVNLGDIVFALRATVGKVLPVTEELNGANLTQGTAKISPKDCIDSSFLLWAMRTSQIQNAIRLEQKGTTFMEITLKNLRNIQVMFPRRKSEQLMIAERLNFHDQLRKKCVKQQNKLISIKTALMQDLLTGKVRVTPLLNEETNT